MWKFLQSMKKKMMPRGLTKFPLLLLLHITHTYINSKTHALISTYPRKISCPTLVGPMPRVTSVKRGTWTTLSCRVLARFCVFSEMKRTICYNKTLITVLSLILYITLDIHYMVSQLICYHWEPNYFILFELIQTRTTNALTVLWLDMKTPF